MKIQTIFLILVLGVVSCTTQETTISQTPQPCPTWSGSEAGECTLKVEKITVREFRRIDMGDYNAVRMTLLNGELLVNDAVGIFVQTDDGEVFNHQIQRMISATYLVSIDAEADSHSFNLTNPGETYVTVSLEYVKFGD